MNEEVKLSPEVRAVLETADCNTGYEVPREDWESFPWRRYISEIETIQNRINTELNISLKRDKNVQDASYLDELFIYRNDAFLNDGIIVHTVQIGIRFSNFGKLYTIYASDISDTNKFDVQGIKRIVDSFGWTYVPAEELRKVTYDGKHKELRGEVSWWIRFFDYV